MEAKYLYPSNQDKPVRTQIFGSTISNVMDQKNSLMIALMSYGVRLIVTH